MSDLRIVVFPILESGSVRAADTADKILYIDQIRLAQALAFAFDQAALLFQLVVELRGFVVAAVQRSHGFFQREDDIHPTGIIRPAVPGRQVHAVKEDSIQQLGVGGHIPEPVNRENRSMG